ncbi:MAG: spore germination protein, partial [Clostridia bacterium]|nr:spore germination protein [Clostridia bacterium]
TVLGPKECFTECIKTDVALIRRHIASAELVVEQAPLSNISGTRAVLVYHFSAAKPAVVEKLREKLKEMPPAVYLTGGTAEQMLFGNSLSPMPRVLLTERPDRAASHILSGRIVLLIDGSPEAVILPITLFSLMNSPEDVYMNRAVGSLLRVIRYLGALLSVLMPGYFLSLALYHQGILSTEVLSTVVASRRMVFEPIGAELILLLIIFQLIREAGQRVPGSIGQAIGIIGGLIMGQAAVSAHLASSVVLIIVAASGLGNFCIPDYRTQLAASYIRLAFVVSAWLGGLLGMTSALIVMLARLASIESFGMPYLAPLSPKRRAARPALFRGPITGGAIGRASGKSEDVM